MARASRLSGCRAPLGHPRRGCAARGWGVARRRRGRAVAAEGALRPERGRPPPRAGAHRVLRLRRAARLGLGTGGARAAAASGGDRGGAQGGGVRGTPLDAPRARARRRLATARPLRLCRRFLRLRAREPRGRAAPRRDGGGRDSARLRRRLVERPSLDGGQGEAVRKAAGDGAAARGGGGRRRRSRHLAGAAPSPLWRCGRW